MATVPVSTRSTTYTLASDSAGPFEVGFRIFDPALAVYVDDVLTSAFSLSATFTGGYADGATITFTDPVLAGSAIVIDGAQPIARSADYLNPDPNLTRLMNIEFGRVWAAMQQLARDSGRSIVAPSRSVKTAMNSAEVSMTSPAAFDQVILISNGMAIPYVWDADDRSAEIGASDPRYIAQASDQTGETGAWVRAGADVQTYAPGKWPSVDGSLYNGPLVINARRVGGWGPYGVALIQHSDDAELPTGELSSTLTTWNSAKHQTGGTIFGAWLGANGPYLGQTGHSWTAGAIVGTEINAGNRYEELGLIGDIAGASRWTVGLQVVPDVLPADGMSAPAGIFHGSFGIAVHQSIHGHKWQTGFIVSADAIAAGGIGFKVRGGTVLGNAPSHGLYMEGYHTNGIVVAGNLTNALAVTGTATRGLDLSSATLTTAIRMAAGQGISWGTGGAQISTTGGSLSLSSGNADDDFAIYANNFGSRVFSADATGGVPRISFYNGVTPVAKQTVTGSWSGGTAGPNLAAALAALGLITNSTTA